MGRILIRGEPGHDIVPELYPLESEPVIDKPGKGAFYQTDLDLMLRNRGIDTLFVAGVTTEVCVNTTVREANDRGFRCIVLSDCCASYFPEFHRRRPRHDQGAGRHFRSRWPAPSVARLLRVDSRREASGDPIKHLQRDWRVASLTEGREHQNRSLR